MATTPLYAPGLISPRAADALPTGHAWIYQPKLDGFRALLLREGRSVALRGRNGGDLGARHRDLLGEAMATLPDRIVLDGELVAINGGGVSFDRLMAGVKDDVALVVFDILGIDGGDVRAEPLQARRTVLERVLDGGHGRLALIPQTEDARQAREWLGGCPIPGVEGVVAKRRDDAYAPGRASWVKIKTRNTADVVVVGMRGRQLVVAAYDGQGLRYLGETVPLSEPEAARWAARLEPCAAPSFLGPAPGTRHWARYDGWSPCAPELVVEVSYTQIHAGAFRHSVRLHRQRPDKRAADCGADQLDRVV